MGSTRSDEAQQRSIFIHPVWTLIRSLASRLRALKNSSIHKGCQLLFEKLIQEEIRSAPITVFVLLMLNPLLSPIIILMAIRAASTMNHSRWLILRNTAVLT